MEPAVPDLNVPSPEKGGGREIKKTVSAIRQISQMSMKLEVNKRTNNRGGVWSRQQEKELRSHGTAHIQGAENTIEEEPDEAVGCEEILTSQSERIRMKLIKEFRLLESIQEMEEGLESPKYSAFVKLGLDLRKILIFGPCVSGHYTMISGFSRYFW